MAVVLSYYLQTGSLIYETETDAYYEDFYEDKSLLYFNDYPKDLRFFDPVIGKK